jgi:DNA-binding NarL/FixJ family response regulator
MVSSRPGAIVSGRVPGPVLVLWRLGRVGRGWRATSSSELGLLTEREREVAVAIGRGKSNAEISRELYMSVATVKAHVSRLLEKFEFNNRVQIALLAHDAGEA